MNVPQEFYISFHVNGAKRSRSMPFLPRVGDIVQLDDSYPGSEFDWMSLHVDSIYIREDGASWTYWANCTLKS